MEKYGSDKGAVKPTRHNYSILYNSLFKSRFQEPVRIFELGLGTNNVSMASNMGADGKPGASLYAWRELFPKAQIFGADIDRNILFESERIKTFYCDQTSETSIKELWGSNDLQDGFDIIIDDGLHTFEANQCFFENSSKKIRPGGYYIIEDILTNDKDKFKVGIKLWKKLYPHLTFSVELLPLDSNTYDNNLLVIHYPVEKTVASQISNSERKYTELSLLHPTGNRQLVYFCVFFNREYFVLADLLIKSVRLFSDTSAIDFLIVTTEEFKENVYNLCSSTGLYINIMTVSLKTMFQAACARLHIFDYRGLERYEKILYLDTDILVKGNLQVVFDLPIRDYIYGIESGTVQSPSFGAQFFGNSIDPSVRGFNSGTLLFRNCLVIRDLFSRIRGHCEAHEESGAAIPYCMDQPFINYHAIKAKLHNNTLLNSHVSLFEGYDEVKNEATSVICHFSYPIGNVAHKLNRMSNYFKNLLESRKSSVGERELEGKSYTWGSGRIRFADTRVFTTWAAGKCQSLGSNWFRVDWNNFYHVLKFNDDLTEYFGLRIMPTDFDTCEGRLV
jgi:SAM-dependent methyltransferase